MHWIKNTAKLTLVLTLLFYQACREKECHDPQNQDCVNYDPCYGKERINSIFRVRPGDNGFQPPEDWCNLIPCDTFNSSSVRFDIPLNNPINSIYTWQIGTETNARIAKSFEVDFSDYLNAGNWEKHIPVTLTIKTPLNSCMETPRDTLVTVTRNLYFTGKRYSNFYPRTTLPVDSVIEKSFTGYLTNNPADTFTFKITKIIQNYYDGYNISGLAYFFVGLPFADSIMIPRDVSMKGCGNYRHVLILTNRFNNPKFGELTHHMSRIDYIVESPNKRTIKLQFFNNFHEPCTFIGEEN